MKKVVLIVIAVILLLFAGFIYVSFSGLPWKKAAVANELKTYVEEKYDISVSLKEKHFNFKDYNYGATFIVEESGVEFHAAKIDEGVYSDYYAEAVWVKEAEDDVFPFIETSFSELSMDHWGVSSVYGLGDEYKIKKEVPSYKEIDAGVDLGIHFNDAWNKENEDKLVREVTSFIETCHSNGIKNIAMRFYLQDKPMGDERTSHFSILIEAEDLNDIQTEEDVRKHISIF